MVLLGSIYVFWLIIFYVQYSPTQSLCIYVYKTDGICNPNSCFCFAYKLDRVRCGWYRGEENSQ